MLPGSESPWLCAGYAGLTILPCVMGYALVYLGMKERHHVRAERIICRLEDIVLKVNGYHQLRA